MAFGLNRCELIGRLGADVTVNHLASGGRVANLSVATDESYIRDGQRIDRTEWHRLVTFQDGLIDMLQKHARKGRLVYVEGKLQTRRWKKDGEDSDRFSTEILIVPGSRVQFLERPNGNGGGHAAPPAQEAAVAQGGAPESMDDFDDAGDIPFITDPSIGRSPPGAAAFFVPSSKSTAIPAPGRRWSVKWKCVKRPAAGERAAGHPVNPHPNRREPCPR